ncbi:hypothetical protein BKA64DRAFT_7103 [Cadophora sp. MPI-SDFR-AT-0126]|nr:hypothetical protein BKA64DRAFT_7103 [Leotiomycetes sp. MPI-SDFR-AT-0126]
MNVPFPQLSMLPAYLIELLLATVGSSSYSTDARIAQKPVGAKSMSSNTDFLLFLSVISSMLLCLVTWNDPDPNADICLDRVNMIPSLGPCSRTSSIDFQVFIPACHNSDIPPCRR